MNWLTYILQGFGFENIEDYSKTLSKGSSENIITLALVLASIREYTEHVFKLDSVVILAFVLLIVAEWYTGIKVDMKERGQKFKSRKSGRMILKIGTYIFILFLLSSFAHNTQDIDFKIFQVNPMQWLYYVVFTWIILQLLISYFENLSALGYKEVKGLIGIILRKGNKWFEFDGEKDGDKLFRQDKNEGN